MSITTLMTADDTSAWALPTLVTQGPGRILADSAAITKLQARWTDTDWSGIVGLYDDDTDAFDIALNYLATGTTTNIATAVSDALDETQNVGVKDALLRSDKTLWLDKAVFVLCWCYPALTTQQKSDLASFIDENNASRELWLAFKMQLHEAHRQGFHAYIGGALAVEGETGITSRLQKASNAMWHYCQWQNESMADGVYQCYAYQDCYFTLPLLMWEKATGRTMKDESSFLENRPHVISRLMNDDGSRMWAGVGDQARWTDGYLTPSQMSSAWYVDMVASHLQDGYIQWVANKLKDGQTVQSGWAVNTSQPVWLSLLYHDDDLTATTPATAEEEACAVLETPGYVFVRSDWDDNSVRAFANFSHFEPDHGHNAVGHFEIWKGDDELFTLGRNYGNTGDYDTNVSPYSFWSNSLNFYKPGDKEFGGSQLYSSTSDAITFPWSNALSSNPEIGVSGKILSHSDDGDVLKVVGSCTDAYDSRVSKYTRTIYFIRPSIFVLVDEFSTQGLEDIVMNFWTRVKPTSSFTEQIIAGTSTAGIMDIPVKTFKVTKGSSQAVLQVLSPRIDAGKLVGGTSYDAYFDDAQYDVEAGMASFLQGSNTDGTQRRGKLAGQFRTQLHFPVSTTKIVTVIGVTASDDPVPSFTVVDNKIYKKIMDV